MTMPRFFAVFALASLLAACASSPPARFFVVHPLAVVEDARELPGGVNLMVQPVELPRYLDRPQLVTRGGAQELSADEFARWAEPLPALLTRVLAENLARLLPAPHARGAEDASGARRDVRVSVQVTELEAEPGAALRLRARLRVTSGEAVPLREIRAAFERDVPWDGRDPSGYAAAVQQVVDELSHAAAAAVSELLASR